jgi:hypothetical protein
VSQSDYVVSNGTGAAVRSDINGQLAAIVTQNSGATEPTTTYAYMRWADTTAGVMKMRNGANSAWITLYQLDGEWSTIAFENGTAAAPSIYFKDSGTDTGFYSPGANQVGISTGGTAALVIDSSQRVGLGTSTPSELFHVSGTSNPSIQLTATNDTTPAISVATDGTNRLQITSSSVVGGNINVRSNQDLRFGTNNTERVRITSGGLVGIGTTSPGYKLDVNAESNLNGIRIGLNGDTINSTTGGASALLTFQTNSTERARIDSSGRLLIGTSSAIGATPLQIRPSSSYYGIRVDGAAEAGEFYRYTADQYSTGLIFHKSRNATIGSNTIVQNNDSLGALYYYGANGTGYDLAAKIEALVDGTPGASNDMPGRLVFSTTADGASSPTERMRILADGNTRFANCTDVYPNTDNAVRLGASGVRWSAVWAANGTIQTSDERAKKDIADAQLGSEFIKSLRPVSYKWIEGGKRDTGERDEKGNYTYESVPGTRTHWGFIAQEVKESVDAAGVDFGGWVLTDKDDPDSQQALRYDQFIAPLTKALQEALAKIETLEAKVAALEAS